MKLIFGSDHAGFELKKFLIEQAKNKNFEIIDTGPAECCTLNYALESYKMAQEFLKIKAEGSKVFGVAICGSGIGVSMALNRFSEIRAARVASKEDAFLARSHNDANFITLGSRQLGPSEAWEFLEIFLETAFEANRHLERVETLGKKGEKT